ncbi:MAG: hypothetical protein AABY13_03865, partial [Nanoarchaeota archaeon]
MPRRKNVITVVLVAILKAFWYVTKGVVLAIWWVLTRIGNGILALFKRSPKKTNVPFSSDQSLPAPLQGKKRHTATDAPFVAKEVATGDFNEFSKRLANTSIIALIVGKRGSGKSTLGFRIMENIHAQTERPCFVLGVKASVLPSWITQVHSVEQVKNNGVVLVAEGALT